MTSQNGAKDLVILTADSQMQSVVETLMLHRRQSLGISDLSFDVRRHPQQDSGCRTASQAILNPLRDTHRRAMVIYDRHGSGGGDATATELERDLELQYERAGWGSGQVACVVIDPELDVWVFGASPPRLRQAFDWSQPMPIPQWLESNGYMQPGTGKPDNPKGAVDAILSLQRRQRSAKLYADLARTTGLARCQDRAFQKFRSTLQRWFPAG